MRLLHFAAWLALVCPALAVQNSSGHIGPQVAFGNTATGRFAGKLYDAYKPQKALAIVRYIDGFYRAPGNAGYNASLDHVREQLKAAGFGEGPGFELEEYLTPMVEPAWTPISGRLGVSVDGGEEIVLHAFDKPGDPDRVMLPINAPNADVEGEVVFDPADVVAGSILVSSEDLSGRSLKRLAARGAVAVISSSSASFTIDPNGSEDHLDAIQFRKLSASTQLPVAQISARSHAKIRELAKGGGALRLRFSAQVQLDKNAELRTLVARIIGSERPDEAVCIVSHVQEPGAGDNASGVGGMCHAATSLAGLIQSEQFAVPSRTLVFVFGDEMRQSAILLGKTQRKVIAAISADMLGQSNARTGARCLLERSPDPGALDPLLPDEHTPWGAGPVKPEDLVPNGLALIARHGLVDVGRHVGGWLTSENPWEGGSDHDIFLNRGIPGILVWHFTDFTYHTGLDRMDRLDPEELRRTSSAVVAAALTVADLHTGDLERLKASNRLELELRVQAALDAERPDVARRWREWCHGVDLWLNASVVDPVHGG